MRAALPIAVVALACSLGACADGTGRVAPAAANGTKSALVGITIVVPAGRSSSTLPRYVSPATAAVAISVNGGAAQTYPLSGGTSCTPPQSGETCTIISIDAPVGTDTFAVTLLDASARALSQATAQATIVSGAANTVHFVANGVVASLSVAVNGPNAAPGAAAVRALILSPLDADGYVITGTAPPITVTDTDASGATALFIGSDATCATATGPSSSSVTATQSNGAYPTVCLSYDGATMSSSATISASSSGVPPATTTFRASTVRGTAGAWALGNATSSGPYELVRFDGSDTIVQTIAGSNANLTLYPAGMDSDAAGNVYVLGPNVHTAFTIQEFSPAQSGNVAPIAVTSFTLPDQGALRGPALDGHGGAYVIGYGNNGGGCAIYYVPLANGAVVASQVYDCTADSEVHNALEGFGLRVSPSGDVWAAYDNTSHGPATGRLFRYVVVNGALAAAGTASPTPGAPDDLAFFPSGNEIALANALAADYTWSVTVSGSTIALSNPQTTSVEGFVAVDPSANLFVADSNNVYLLPPGSTSPTATTPFTARALAPASH